jgi:hypothetical protein
MNISIFKKYTPTIDNSLKHFETFLILNAMKSHNKRSFFTREKSSIEQYFKTLNKSDFQFSLENLPKFSEKLMKFPIQSKKDFTFSFKTPYKPNKYFKKSFEDIKKFHDVKVNYFPYKGKIPKEKRKALIYIHGWGKGSLITERLWHFRIFQLSYKADIFAIELPYHLSRNPGGFSGQGFLDKDPIRTVEAFKQSIIEVMFLYKGLKAIYKTIGISGISLGGHIASYVSLFINDDIFLLPCLAGTPFAQNVKNLRITPNLMNYVRKHNIDKYLEILDFRNFKAIKKEKLFLFGGRFDSVIDSKTVLRLGKHLQCKTYIMPTGHFTFAFSLPYITTKIAKW